MLHRPALPILLAIGESPCRIFTKIIRNVRIGVSQITSKVDILFKKHDIIASTVQQLEVYRTVQTNARTTLNLELAVKAICESTRRMLPVHDENVFEYHESGKPNT